MTRSRQPYLEPDQWQPDPLPSGSLNPPGRKPPTAVGTAFVGGAVGAVVVPVGFATIACVTTCAAGLLIARRSVQVPSIFNTVRRVPRRRRAA